MPELVLYLPDDIYNKIARGRFIFSIGLIAIIFFMCIFYISMIYTHTLFMFIIEILLLIVFSIIWNLIYLLYEKKRLIPAIEEKFLSYSYYNHQNIVGMLNDEYEIPIDFMHKDIEFIRIECKFVDSAHKDRRNNIKHKRFITFDNIILVVHYNIKK